MVVCASCGNEVEQRLLADLLCVECWNVMHGHGRGSVPFSRSWGTVCELDRADGFYSVPGRLIAWVKTEKFVEEVLR